MIEKDDIQTFYYSESRHLKKNIMKRATREEK